MATLPMTTPSYQQAGSSRLPQHGGGGGGGGGGYARQRCYDSGGGYSQPGLSRSAAAVGQQPAFGTRTRHWAEASWLDTLDIGEGGGGCAGMWHMLALLELRGSEGLHAGQL